MYDDDLADPPMKGQFALKLEEFNFNYLPYLFLANVGAPVIWLTTGCPILGLPTFHLAYDGDGVAMAEPVFLFSEVQLMKLPHCMKDILEDEEIFMETVSSDFEVSLTFWELAFTVI